MFKSGKYTKKFSSLKIRLGIKLKFTSLKTVLSCGKRLNCYRIYKYNIELNKVQTKE